MPAGQTPHTTIVYAHNDLVDKVQPGDRVNITGKSSLGHKSVDIIQHCLVVTIVKLDHQLVLAQHTHLSFRDIYENLRQLFV